ncbi:hypothetical protein AZE42_08533 [Rhizopogon vesiculosus]|uniref:Uncharacterized protein n=1 Tax=Rhizopogon vesiculosus TaxID=180088 RepID=A0A1J8Q8P4_9AGAM|nr:hypothetical protein AZE42_08533 [Rhizopogon vesiculosus]
MKTLRHEVTTARQAWSEGLGHLRANWRNHSTSSRQSLAYFFNVWESKVILPWADLRRRKTDKVKS